MRHLALLRGINVGGKSMLRMSELASCFEEAGFADVRTYINSGNVLFDAARAATARLSREIEAAVEKRFAMNVGVTVFTAREWHAVVKSAPKWWGDDKDWKHNLFALLPGTKVREVMQVLNSVKPAVERFAEGPRVIYLSLESAPPGRTTTTQLPSHPLNRRITVRNFKTTMKLADLLAAT